MWSSCPASACAALREYRWIEQEDETMPHQAKKACETCGTEITAEQIVQREAGLVGGVLLCPTCVNHKREELLQARHAATPAAGAAKPTHHADATETIGESQGSVYLPPDKKGPDEADEPLSLVSEAEVSTGGPSKIRTFARGDAFADAHAETDFKRPLAGINEPATRCRTFHGKLTQPGLAHMDEQINEWLDSHPDLYIKTCASTVGIFEGKTKEPHLLVTMFY
jgi:hypothetical protein